jgi:galactokinase
VNLVAREHVENFQQVVAEGYKRETKLKPEIFVCEPADGAGEVMTFGVR